MPNLPTLAVLFFAVVFLVVFGSIAADRLRRQVAISILGNPPASRDRERPGQYEAAPVLLSPAERSFFGVMEQALNGEFRVFVKIRLADIVRPVRNESRSGWQAAFNRICGKHVDFVICDAERLNVIAVVELDDQSHKRFERGIRDVVVNSALSDAGIPIVRITARHSYSPVELRHQVERAIEDRVAHS